MKKLASFLSMVLIFAACSGSQSNKEEVTEEINASTKAVETATEELETSAEELENKVKSTEKEIDSLLNDI